MNKYINLFIAAFVTFSMLYEFDGGFMDALLGFLAVINFGLFLSNLIGQSNVG